MAGDRTRIGLWRPQVGLQGSRGGVHVHFALHIAEADYDAAITAPARRRPRRPRARVQDPPALALGLRQRPRRPPRRAVDVGRGGPPSGLTVEALALVRPPVRAVASTSLRWTSIRLPLPPNFTPPRTEPEAPPESSSTSDTVRSTMPCVADPAAARPRREPTRRPRQRGVEQRPRDREVPGIAQVQPHQRLRDPVAAVDWRRRGGTRARAARRGRTCTRRATPRGRCPRATAGTAARARPSSRPARRASRCRPRASRAPSAASADPPAPTSRPRSSVALRARDERRPSPRPRARSPPSARSAGKSASLRCSHSVIEEALGRRPASGNSQPRAAWPRARGWRRRPRSRTDRARRDADADAVRRAVAALAVRTTETLPSERGVTVSVQPPPTSMLNDRD